MNMYWPAAGLARRSLNMGRSTTYIRNTRLVGHRRMFSSLGDSFSNITQEIRSDSSSLQLRKDVLRNSLQAIGIDADELERAVEQSMIDSTAGYDNRYGRSAIRTCLSFYYPKKESTILRFESDRMQLNAAGARTARQIEFLTKRHQSHQTAWIRHHDSQESQPAEMGQHHSKRFPLTLLLDNLRSAHNVGSLFRTADAAGCAQVITVGITPHPFGNGTEKLQKSALGAELTVPSRHFATIGAALNHLRLEHDGGERRCQIVGMETTAQSVLYTDFDYDSSQGVVLVLGNEVTGVDASIMSQLDGIIEIPMFGTKNSLNVAACAPIVLYEIIRQWSRRRNPIC